MTPQLPISFCWSKFGDEAGEESDFIIARKELERVKNDGVFLWGIGTSIGPSLRELLRVQTNPRVLFTPMLSKSSPKDMSPMAIAVWRSAQTMDGDPYLLPRHSVVTSRATPGSPPERHYALVCRSEFSLTERAEELWIDNADLRNLRSDALVGSSQVTSVVRHLSRGQRGQRKYTVAFSATLESPYLIKLKDCILEMTKNVDEEVSSA